MSVGVCVVNKNGIALAADSAGTFGKNSMFYNSVNKIFPLSNKYSYGAITYGVLAIQGVSVEQLLKEFQVFLDDIECVDDFFNIVTCLKDFIRQKNQYYRFDISEKQHCEFVIETLVNDWGSKIKAVLSSSDVDKQIEDILDKFEKHIGTLEKVDNFDVGQYISNQYVKYYESKVKIVVPELDNFPEKKNRFWELIKLFFEMRLNVDEDQATGLLLAGYGKNDAFPKYVYLEVYRVVGGVPKIKIKKQYSFNNSSVIQPVAQSEMIMTFCKGISDKLTKFISEKVEEYINTQIGSIQNTFSNTQLLAVQNAFKNSKSDISKIICDKYQSDNVDPLLNSVSSLPLTEMAYLAENLVDITSLQRTYVIDGNQQTVGGPTDVAILSKVDGFEWIKRKTRVRN